MSDVTRILEAIENGDTRAVDKLLPAVYEDLRQLAAQKLSRERAGHTLQPTALVHEAYIRLAGQQIQNWNSRTHFFAAAAEAMRRILIDSARRKRSLKRGGDRQRLELDEATILDDSRSEEVLALDEALENLAQRDKVKADLVKLRYFAGLTVGQAAQILGISRSTADEFWAYAKAWLRLEIDKGNAKTQR